MAAKLDLIVGRLRHRDGTLRPASGNVGNHACRGHCGSAGQGRRPAIPEEDAHGRPLDHLVLTTARPEGCIGFYMRVLGMQLETFDGATPPLQRQALRCGRQKIDLHVQGAEFEPKAQPVSCAPNPCFIASVTLDEVVQQLNAARWPIVEGPVVRRGATQAMRRSTCATAT